jgi:hypothetical protein
VTTQLLQRVTVFVTENPGCTLPEIARAVRAADAAVREVLTSKAFYASARDAYPSDRAQVYQLAAIAAAGLGRAARRSQNDDLEAFFRSHKGEPHTTREIHTACGSSRLNSRIPELKKRRGMDIECIRIPGVPPGPDAQVYIFHGYFEGFGPSEATDTSARAAEAPGAVSVASDGPDGQLHSPAAEHLLTDAGPSDSQLDLDAAA